MNIKRVILPVVVFSGLGAAVIAVSASTNPDITTEKVLDAQNSWGDAIVEIGKTYTSDSNYKGLARVVVNSLYAYDEGTVLFKPTKAVNDQFRGTREEAISYFVTGSVEEDLGFAIQPWSKVRFENSDIIIDSDSALAMGNYYFTDANTGNEAKVEYTFGYIVDEKGNLRINLHHSSFPYNPK